MDDPTRPLTVCLTGGGTAGHVTPHFALLPGIKERGWRVFYVGSAGLERPLVEAAGIEFVTVATGKLRRYLSFQNLLDLGKVALGCLQAFLVLRRRRPDVVFSKGGFVAVPVAWAAWALRIPVVTHESDLTPGLATRLIQRVARRIVYTFPETGKYLRPGALQVGTPIRPELFQGSRSAGERLCAFAAAPAGASTLLVMGGSQGAQRLNEALRAILPELVERHRVVHLTGKGKGVAFAHANYKSFEFVGPELKDLLALADAVVSRAGANSIFELLALGKPMLLVPLELGSRGDQVLNAEAFRANGWAAVLRETALSGPTLQGAIAALLSGAGAMRAAQAQWAGGDAAAKVLDVIAQVARPGA
jgi:UDP-N-acetylglucosamine--N-acetylmuramyl-(pentapeptide) pyrophosphoryl-undecaprenol N-acetylglucosamine transferase